MSYSRFKFTAMDGVIINVHKWGLEEGQAIKGIVQISHGMASGHIATIILQEP